jgi:WD40 repeat protein
LATEVALPIDFTVTSISFHPNGKYLLCSTSNQGSPNLFLIQTAEVMIINKLLADDKGLESVRFCPKGEKIVAYGSSGTVTIWDATKLLKQRKE